jgi:hypothetical protein
MRRNFVQPFYVVEQYQRQNKPALHIRTKPLDTLSTCVDKAHQSLPSTSFILTERSIVAIGILALPQIDT